MTLPTLSPVKAHALLKDGALLVDIRAADEFARENIPGARNVPLSEINAPVDQDQDAAVVIFHCRSGARTTANAGKLQFSDACDAYILEGGIDDWKKAGLPVNKDTSQPIEIMRQVQIAAGGLVFGGVLLGALAHPAFYGLSGFVGAGLMFAGITGTCGMAKVLGMMPWNRRASRGTLAAA